MRPDAEPPLPQVTASLPRRVFACGVLYLAGAGLLYAALQEPPPAAVFVALVAFGIAMLVVADLLRRATGVAIVLTDTDLRDTQGRVLARLDQIRRIDHGALALKPANGFTLVLAAPQPRGWVPGLWWRLGRRVGVGGVTNAREARAMATLIAAHLAAHPPRRG